MVKVFTGLVLMTMILALLVACAPAKVRMPGYGGALKPAHDLLGDDGRRVIKK